MSPKILNKLDLIAPCGLNCRLCRAYLREKKKCPGCRGGRENKANACLNCKIKNCHQIRKGLQFCYLCPNYPCATLEHLDARYRTKYNISAKENLATIESSSLEQFVASEDLKWTCPACGGTISMHSGLCNNCKKSEL